MVENDTLWRCEPADPDSLVNDVQVWAAWLDTASEEMSWFWSTLSNRERERAGRFVFARDRTYFIAAHGLLRWILAWCLGTEPSQIELRCGNHGKPTLGGALAQSGLQFNLAHSANLAVFAVARHRNIGVDVERVRPVSQLAELSGAFFSAGERAELEAMPDQERDAGFLKIWTRKEAWLKATGEGITGSLNLIDVSGLPRRKELKGRPTVGSPGPGLRLHDLVPAPGFLGALAATEP